MLTNELGVTDDTELFTMLHFYHDLGTIIYFGGQGNSNQYLQDMVILNPQWLIDIFKRIITVMPHQKQVNMIMSKIFVLHCLIENCNHSCFVLFCFCFLFFCLPVKTKRSMDQGSSFKYLGVYQSFI